MSSYNELLALIDAYINQNGVQAITGQVLNGVLRAMVDQLGRGYAIMGAAQPNTDPGTPDAPESWFASTPGTYTNFDGLTVANAELALLSYSPTDQAWTKQTLTQGIVSTAASVDNNVGTPSVTSSYVNGVLTFTFQNLKGNPGQDGQDGDAAGFGTVSATVDGNVGTPGVSVQTSGPNTAKNMVFQFTNLKGETGVTSVVATVDNTSGSPQCAVSLSGGVLTLAFTGLKGAQGDTGSSVAYPFTIVNNLTTNDATQALSAAMGVQLESEISQLEHKIDGNGVPFTPTWQRVGYYVANNGTVTASADWNVSDPILLKKYHTIIVKMKSGSGAAVVASTDENGTSYTQLIPTSSYHGNSVTSIYRYTAKQDEYIAVSVKVANDYTVEEAVEGLEKETDMTVKAVEDAMVSPNKFDRFSIVRGGMYAVNASWINNPTYYSSDFIPVMPGDTVKITFAPLSYSQNGNWTAFKSDKVTSAGGGQANIQQSSGSYEFTVPSAWSETRYIAIGFIFEVDPSTIVVTVNGNMTFKIPQTAVEGLTTALNGKQNQLTAGDNITISSNVISTKTGVFVNETQNLTDTQKETARDNINAASEGEITYVNTAQVNAAADISGWSYGYVKPDGSIKNESGGSWKYSGKIPIVPETPIVVNKMYCNTAVSSVAAYGENDNFIAECSLSQSSSISASNPVTIQTTGKNVAYIRITAGGGYPDYNVTVTQYSGVKTIKEVIEEIQDQIDDIEGELDGISVGTQWNGKSWVALGTSITDTKNTLAPDGTSTGKFLPFLTALSGLTVTDKGVAGAVIGGHILYYAGHTAETANAALVTIEGGVNDWAGNRPLGQVGDTVPYLVEWTSPVWNNGGSAEGTFAGACYQAIKTAMDNSPKAVVVVLTDNTGRYIALTGQHCERERQNSLGLLQKDYTDMLIAVAHYMGVPVINAGQRSMINQDNPDYLIDQIHQTELGGEQYANVIWSELKMLPNRITE